MVKGIKTTIQESKGKFTTTIPISLVKILGINKSDTLIWNLEDNKITIHIKEIIKQ